MSDVTFGAIIVIWFACGIVSAVCVLGRFSHIGRSFSGKVSLSLFSVVVFFMPPIFFGIHIQERLEKNFGVSAQYFASFVVFSLFWFFGISLFIYFFEYSKPITFVLLASISGGFLATSVEFGVVKMVKKVMRLK